MNFLWLGKKKDYVSLLKKFHRNLSLNVEIKGQNTYTYFDLSLAKEIIDSKEKIKEYLANYCKDKHLDFTKIDNLFEQIHNSINEWFSKLNISNPRSFDISTKKYETLLKNTAELVKTL